MKKGIGFLLNGVYVCCELGGRQEMYRRICDGAAISNVNTRNNAHCYRMYHKSHDWFRLEMYSPNNSHQQENAVEFRKSECRGIAVISCCPGEFKFSCSEDVAYGA